MHPDGGLRQEGFRPERGIVSHLLNVDTATLRDDAAHLRPSRLAEGKEPVESRLTEDGFTTGHIAEEPAFREHGEVQHLVSDGDADASRFVFVTRKHAEGQVLDRKMRIRRNVDERPQPRVVGGVHGRRPAARRSSRGSSKEQEPKLATNSRAAEIVPVAARQ